MKAITMSPEQTATYDADDAAAVELMRELRRQAQEMIEAGEADSVEIYTDDGIVAEVVG